jgi:dihydroorotate dehydrogenase electron transfer subunit
MKLQITVKVIKNSSPSPEHVLLSLHCPKLAKISKPGQFIMIKCGASSDPLLRRPISLNCIDKQKGTIDILFRVIGKGTKFLSSLKKGAEIDVIGPLGNGFSINNKQTAVLIGGGAGIAPLLPIAKQLKGKNVITLIGSNTKKAVLLEKAFKGLGCKTVVTTDDGTYAKKGRVTDALVALIEKDEIGSKSMIYACGPHPMINSVKELCKRTDIAGQVSLEEWMACGVGACNGCTVNTINGYKKVCSDGPIFDIKELL